MVSGKDAGPAISTPTTSRGRDNRGPRSLSDHATQASAITFLSTPDRPMQTGCASCSSTSVFSGHGHPCSTRSAHYHRLKVYRVWYLEGRFDVKTRTLASSLFLCSAGWLVH